MINRLIEWSLRNRFLVVCGVLLVIGLGIWSLFRTQIDAIPDLSENQVIVFADWPGRSPQEVEDQITYPLSVNLQGLAGVKTVRASSMFGFSLITVIFEDNVDNYFARTRILERLNFLGDLLPQGVTPRLGPDATGLGWVYQYYFEVDPEKAPNGGYDLGQLRAVQDWFVRYQLNAVPGVAEVASIGGFVRQYQVELSSTKMRAAGVSLGEVLNAVDESNLNVGGKVIEENGMEFVVRGIGLVENPEDLRQVVLKEVDGTPVYLKDVAVIQMGGDFRRGTLDIDGREVVGGIVVMRTGENAMEVIRAVKEKIAQISPSLPPGVSIEPFYDRSGLIERTIETLRHALIEEIILVTLAHIIFLWHFRSILIVTFPLPVSILISFILMNLFGISSNIMSLAGIAIAIGVLVDAAIVMTENVIRHAEKAEEAKQALAEMEGRSISNPPPASGPADRCGTLADHPRSIPSGRPPDLLRDGYYHPGFRSGLRAYGAGRQTLSPARIHQNVRDDRFNASGCHHRAGALRRAGQRPVSFRGTKSRHGLSPAYLRSGSELGSPLPPHGARTRCAAARTRAHPRVRTAPVHRRTHP